MTGVVKVGLGELVTDARAGFACGEDDPEGVFQVRMNNITRTGHMDLSRRRRVPATMPAIQNCLLQTGDVLFNATNSPEMVGKTAVVSELDEPTVFSNHFIRLRVDEQKISPHYLARWLHYQFELGVFRTLCRQWVNQATVPRDSLLSLAVPLLPLAEQTRVTEVLDQVDALRAKRSESLARLDELAQSIFLDMFGDPGTNPMAWPEVPLGRLFDIPPNYGTMTPARERRGGDWLCLRVANIQGWNLDLSNRKYVQLDSSAVARHSVQDGDMLMARAIASQEHLGKAVVVHPGEERWAFDSHLMRIRFNADLVEPEYIRTLLRSPGGRTRFLGVTRRSAVQFNINTKELAGLVVPVPNIDCQREFVARLGEVDGLRSKNVAQMNELDSLFGALQAHAFSAGA